MATNDMASSPYLTTREVAELLRLKERKIYDLVSTGQIPFVRVTGKLLFPRDLIERWLLLNTEYASGVALLKERPLICAGSHDPLLEWALREATTGLAVNFGGSLDGIDRLARGEAVVAGVHVREVGSGTWNVDTVAHLMPRQPVVLIEWARRKQGLITAPGNPLHLLSVSDLKGRRVIGRQAQSGTFLLLRDLLAERGLSLADLNLLDPPGRTEGDVAAAIAEERADAGLGIAAVAKQYRLGFVPLLDERYDLLVWRPSYFNPPLQRLMAFVRTERFREKAAHLDGYDLSALGQVRYNG
jgi:excisionase family DNA binding protein